MFMYLVLSVSALNASLFTDLCGNLRIYGMYILSEYLAPAEDVK